MSVLTLIYPYIINTTSYAYYIRPILRGRDIKRYSFEFQKLWLITTFPSCKYDIENYPAIKNHLLSYNIHKLEQSGKEYVIDGKRIKSRKKTNNKWFETQDSINYWDDFNKQKIIYPETTQGAYFVLDDSNYYIDKTCFMITGEHLKYLLGILSSILFEYAYKNIFTSIELGKSGYQYNKYSLLKLPIYSPTEGEKHNVERLIDKIILERNFDYISELNNYLFSIYDISEKEKEEILKFTKNT